MAAATIADLSAELVTKTKEVTDLMEKTYSVFSVDDMATLAGIVEYPLAGVVYEGGSVKDDIRGQQTNRIAHRSAAFITVYFSITVAVDYKAGGNEDNKPLATDLLDGVRSALLGFQGVNSRPWRLTGEQPLQTDLEGVIFYGQMWETDLPVTGI
jgi:hypothetical protein